MRAERCGAKGGSNGNAGECGVGMVPVEGHVNCRAGLRLIEDFTWLGVARSQARETHSWSPVRVESTPSQDAGLILLHPAQRGGEGIESAQGPSDLIRVEVVSGEKFPMREGHGDDIRPWSDWAG
jgi:hypothetical protein